MSQSYDCYYEKACEFTVAIKLNVPIFLEPQVLVKKAPCVKQSLPVHLEPEIFIESEVRANPPVCIPQTCHPCEELPAYQAVKS
jgi:hypothetical protein